MSDSPKHQSQEQASSKDLSLAAIESVFRRAQDLWNDLNALLKIMGLWRADVDGPISALAVLQNIRTFAAKVPGCATRVWDEELREIDSVWYAVDGFLTTSEGTSIAFEMGDLHCPSALAAIVFTGRSFLAPLSDELLNEPTEDVARRFLDPYFEVLDKDESLQQRQISNLANHLNTQRNIAIKRFAAQNDFDATRLILTLDHNILFLLRKIEEFDGAMSRHAIKRAAEELACPGSLVQLL